MFPLWKVRWLLFQRLLQYEEKILLKKKQQIDRNVPPKKKHFSFCALGIVFFLWYKPLNMDGRESLINYFPLGRPVFLILGSVCYISITSLPWGQITKRPRSSGAKTPAKQNPKTSASEPVEPYRFAKLGPISPRVGVIIITPVPHLFSVI